MKNIQKYKPCFICHGRLTDVKSKDTSKLIPTVRRTIRDWYHVCDVCLDVYPDIEKTFKMLCDMPDDDGPGGHAIMFNLIESIKDYRWGHRYIVPFKPKKESDK